jgi:FkbM family methyltransferase
MYIAWRACLRSFFSFLGLGLVRKSELGLLRSEKIEFDALRVKLDFFLETKSIWSINSELDINHLAKNSRSESGQDLFALVANDFSKNKVFIEIGAFDGVTYSNSYMLEKDFKWNGVLVECIPRNFRRIKNSRDCEIIFGAVSGQSGDKIEVFESSAPNLSSTIKSEAENSWRVVSHSVPNYSLDAILRHGKTMGVIGFLSVDIEGAEYSVLKNVNLSQYEIEAICIEHNFRPESQDLKKLIESQGYHTVYEAFSGNDFWFIRN